MTSTRTLLVNMLILFTAGFCLTLSGMSLAELFLDEDIPLRIAVLSAVLAATLQGVIKALLYVASQRGLQI